MSPHTQECPECGEIVNSESLPGDATYDTWGGPVQLEPCGCVVIPTWVKD